MATAVPMSQATGSTLKQRLARAERMNRLKSQALILPLLAFLVLTFLVPIAALLYKSVSNPEVVRSLPLTVEAISAWDGKSLPADAVYKALSQDLAEARRNQAIGDLSKRLNMELAGYRSLMAKTARKLPFKEEPASYKDAMEQLDERWGDPAYWQVIRRNASSYTPYYLLAALDHRIDDLGEVARATPGPGHLPGHLRPHLLDGRGDHRHLPAAGLPAGLPAGQPADAQEQPADDPGPAAVLDLDPGACRRLDRPAAIGWPDQRRAAQARPDRPAAATGVQPHRRIHRDGAHHAAVHDPADLQRDEGHFAELHARRDFPRLPPVRQLLAGVFPQTVAGVGAGCLLVFILSIGYYITPALLGSPNDQMVSYFVAFYTNSTINWGMATALGGLLLLATLVLYVVYSWLVGASRLRLG